jgi:hypothetical protein
MHTQLVLLATLLQIVSPALADRGNAPDIPPVVCNNVPDDTGSPPPSCIHVTDVLQTVCGDLIKSGWCDCGTANYPVLTEGPEQPCGYPSLDGVGILNLQTCKSSITVPLEPGKAKRETSSPKVVPQYRRMPHLQKRQEGKGGQIRFNANCKSPPPDGSKYGESTGHNFMEDVLIEAYNDAVALADAASNIDPTNQGFMHYFGGESVDVQLRHFHTMMNLIAHGAKPFAVEFNCVDSGKFCITTGSQISVMFTDGTKGASNDFKTITACPAFWTAGSTEYLLGTGSSTIGGPTIGEPKTSPNPPYRPRDNTNPGWCSKRKAGDDLNPSAWAANRYATAGTTILHELTHLDALGELVGLEADGNGRHGTIDAQTGCELIGAREFLKDYNAKNTEGTSPDYNAESYVAAATEIYWMNACGFSQIRPYIPSSE